MSRAPKPVPGPVFSSSAIADIYPARLELLEAVRAGRTVDCPCCDRQAKVYRRSFYTVTAKFICDLARLTFETESEWVHVDRLQPKNGNYAFLVHWGFAHPMDRRSEFANSKGFWRITPEGLAFAKGASRAPASVWLFQNTVVRWDPKTISVHEALKKAFDYNEIMRGVP